MFQLFKLFIATFLATLLPLAIWIQGYRDYCAVIVVALLIYGVIVYGFVELSRRRRLCIRECFFEGDSFVGRLLSGWGLIAIFYLVVSIPMWLSLLYFLATLSQSFLIILVIYLLFAMALYGWFKSILHGTIKMDFVPILAREWSFRIGAVVMTAMIFYQLLYAYEPIFLADSLAQTTQKATASIGSHCFIIDRFLRLEREGEAIFWWMAERGSDMVAYGWLSSLIWVGFLLINALGAVGLARYISQMVYLVDRILGGRS